MKMTALAAATTKETDVEEKQKKVLSLIFLLNVIVSQDILQHADLTKDLKRNTKTNGAN